MRIGDLKVVDAPRPLTIQITPTDVKKGNTKDPGGCAAAQSIRREVDGCTDVRVHLGRTYVKNEKAWVRYQTPASLRSEIVAFDRGARFAPGKYVLRPLSAANKLGTARGSATNKTKPNKDRSKSKVRAKYHVVSGVRQHGANR